MILDVVKILLPAVLGFLVGIGITPTITDYLYRNRMWKKKVKSVTVDGREATVFMSLHSEKEVNTPRMGGAIIWIAAFATAFMFWFLAKIVGISAFDQLEFISRNQTWIPFFALLLGAFVGLIDDVMEINGSASQKAGGLSARKRLFFVGSLSFAIAVWFYSKLDISEIFLPIVGYFDLGLLFIPFFMLTMLFIYSGGVIDGVDGLAGGVFTIMFAAYGIIAFSNNQIDLAAFCALIVGATLSFLWFNIPPARFYMSETGSMALTITLTTVALMTDKLGEGAGLVVLPIIALPLVITVLSVMIQLTSKKLRGGKKVFLSTPIHHHFEALGWPSYKVTMRYWVFSVISATLGVIISVMIR
jgi:phospho-N-acetylmuramoyl-pentapeptide-transferase